jgi:hypothetical protein
MQFEGGRHVRSIATVGLLLVGSLATASAQSIIKTDIERDYNGRISSVTSTSDRGTARTDFSYSGTNVQAVTTYDRRPPGAYNPLGAGGYKPLGR